MENHPEAADIADESLLNGPINYIPPERIVRKAIAGFLKEEIKEAVGPLQVCTGHSAGSETAIHAMSRVFVEEGTDGILLIDASNVFNQMNRSVALHNIQLTCKEMSLYCQRASRAKTRGW